MQLENIAAIINAAGAGPLSFVALGLLALTYLSARWFGSEGTAVRITIFAFLFLLICAAPVLLWLSEHYAVRPDKDYRVPPTLTPATVHTASPAAPKTRLPADATQRPHDDTVAKKAAPPSPIFTEEAEPIRLSVSRFDAARKTNVFAVYFPLNSINLQPSEASFLDDVADEYERRGAKSVLLRGYADQQGSRFYNLGLSQRMADAVKAHLSKRNVPEEAISTEALGSSKSAAETGDGMADPSSQRVEVRLR